MAIWNCASCGEDNDSDFGICWNCGVDKDRSATAPAGSASTPGAASFSLPIDDDAPEPRDLKCLRCGTPMHPVGRLRLQTHTDPGTLGYERIGDLLVNRDVFDAYACTAAGCGKVEWFAVTLEEVSLGG